MQFELAADRVTASEAQRTISGRVVPYGEVGVTSVGKTRVTAGAVTTPELASQVKLLTDHDPHDPIAVATSFEDHHGGSFKPPGLYATFSVPAGERGDRALIEAGTTRDGLSVGIEVSDHDVVDGIYEITAGTLHEVSSLAMPAFKSARVTAVAAKQKGPAMADEDTDQAAPEVVAAFDPSLIEASLAELADVTTQRFDKLEAAAGKASEPDPGRDLRDVATELLTASQAKQSLVIEAALGVTATAESAMQEKYVSTIVGTIDSGRPLINSASTADAGPDGLSFSVPHVTAAPTVAAHTEGAEVESTQLTVDWVQHALVTYAGANVLTQQAIDRSNPATLGILITELAIAYAQVTDAAFATALIAAVPIGNSTVTAAGTLQDDVAQLGESIAENDGNFDTCWMGTEKWGDMLKTTVLEAPAFFDGQTLVSNTFPGVVGSMGGVKFVRSPALAADALVGFDSRAAYWWEVSGSPFQLRTVQVSTLTQEIGIYGYGGPEIRRAIHTAEITAT